MANSNNRTLKELAIPNVTYQPLCIEHFKVNGVFELNFGLIYLLPIFHGLTSEDPHKHLKEFHVVYSTIKPHGISKEHIKLKAFPFYLANTTKN